MAITQTVDELPQNPDPYTQLPEAFSITAAASVLAQKNMVPQINIVTGQMNTLSAQMNLVAAGQAFSMPVTFSTATADVDPGPGFVRLDNATQNVATTIRVDVIGADAADWTNVLAQAVASDSTVKSNITLMKVADPTKFITFNATAMALPSGYRNITVAVVNASGATPFANGDSLVMKISRVGDKGATGSAGAGAITNIVTAAVSTTLTSTRTLLILTPTDYGCVAKLPDATALTVQEPYHIVENKGPYPVKVVNGANAVIGFAPPYSRADIALATNGSVAGVWSVQGADKIGIAARLTSTSVGRMTTCNENGYSSIDMDGDIEILTFTHNTSAFLMGVAYKKSTGKFGAVATLRSVDMGTGAAGNLNNVAIKVTATTMLLCSCPVAPGASTTLFEAVVVTLNAGTLALTPGTAATATLASAINSFSYQSGLLSFPSVSNTYVTSYNRSGSLTGLRALSVSGTTVTIGTEVTRSASSYSTACPTFACTTTDKVIVMTCDSNGVQIRGDVWTVSGTTLTVGTGFAVGTASAPNLMAFFPWGTRWLGLHRAAATDDVTASLISLSGTTVTRTTVAALASGNTSPDFAIVGSKVLVVGANATVNCNILTDSAGTVSAGTAITLNADASRKIVAVSGTMAMVANANSGINKVDCSGASPTVDMTFDMPMASQASGNPSRNGRAKRDPSFYCGGDDYTATKGSFPASSNSEKLEFNFDHMVTSSPVGPPITSEVRYLGHNETSRWVTNNTNKLYRYEVAA